MSVRDIEVDPPVASTLPCIVYAIGIIGMLVVYGLAQERIMTQQYGDGKFTHSVFLVLCNRLAAIVFALFMVMVKGESRRNAAPLWKYLAVSFSNVYASSCQYEAFKYVTFPVQMLGKSFKMMPVMLWGIALSGKVYTWTDWGIAGGVTGGVTEFLLTGPTKSESDTGSSLHGLAFLLLFLVLDGFTSTMQEKMFKEHKTTKYNQMIYINCGSAVISLFTLVLTGSLVPSLSFCLRNPTLIRDVTILSASAVAAQWFIYSMVKEFGALIFAGTMNVRQVVSILISYIIYGHSVSPLQVVGLLAVFAALFYKSYAGLASKNDNAKNANETELQEPIVQHGEVPGAAKEGQDDSRNPLV